MAPQRLGFDAIRLAYNRTGLGNYSRFIVRALHALNDDRLLYLYSPGRTALTDEFSDCGPRIQVRTPSKLAGGFWAKNLWRRSGIEAACARDGIQLFHGLAAELPMFRQKKRPATVVTVHDLIYLRYPAYFSPIDRQLYDRRYRSAARRADFLIAISQQTKSDLCEFFKIPPDKVRVIGQGCDPAFYDKRAIGEIQQIRARYGLQLPYLLFVGNVEPRKNVELCLRGMAASPTARQCLFAIVSRPTKYGEKLKKIAVQLGLADRVRFLSNVPTADLPALYQAAQLFLYPSQFEGFGIPVLEAMASGAPVITSSRSSLPEVGGDAVNYVSGDNVEELAAALEALLNDTAQRQTLSARGLARAQNFLPQTIAQQLSALYRDLC